MACVANNDLLGKETLSLAMPQSWSIQSETRRTRGAGDIVLAWLGYAIIRTPEILQLSFRQFAPHAGIHSGIECTLSAQAESRFDGRAESPESSLVPVQPAHLTQHCENEDDITRTVFERRRSEIWHA